MKTQSIILLGHGSKSQDAIDDFNFIVKTIKDKDQNSNVYGAHMELASPSLEDTVADLSESGHKNITVIPYFLFNGNHIKEDIPAKLELLENKYPEINFRFGTPIGKEPQMADIILKKVQELNP